ncbi:hypothetical protein GCM10009665_06940 [Kitasatospora nipponensis]|uniref:Uncharacterized protein n=1 Tax=Kitasatospora nipponensis TaxID=258049 RepID=A0ABN1VQ69_9ACTN
MSDLPPSPGHGDSTSTGRDPGRSAVGTRPRWVNAFGIAAGVLVVVFLIVHLAGSMGGMAGRH